MEDNIWCWMEDKTAFYKNKNPLTSLNMWALQKPPNPVLRNKLSLLLNLIKP